MIYSSLCPHPPSHRHTMSAVSACSLADVFPEALGFSVIGIDEGQFVSLYINEMMCLLLGRVHGDSGVTPPPSRSSRTSWSSVKKWPTEAKPSSWPHWTGRSRGRWVGAVRPAYNIECRMFGVPVIQQGDPPSVRPHIPPMGQHTVFRRLKQEMC